MKFLFQFRIHPGGFYPLVIMAAISLFALVVLKLSLWWITCFLGFGLFFFRDPERFSCAGERALLSPGDGVVLHVTRCSLPDAFRTNPSDSREPSDVPQELFQETWTKVSIFLSVFDVHVNRIPLEGKIVERLYFPGKFFNASLDKSSHLNERSALCIRQDSQSEPPLYVWCVQVAGLIARRILCDVEKGDEVKRGQRYGLIRFGSRLDLYLPPSIEVAVCGGQTVIGGETPLGYRRLQVTQSQNQDHGNG